MDLSTKYNGLKIKNPIIVGSSGLTNTVEKNKKLAENNAGAIVIKSLFEEQIMNEAYSDMKNNAEMYAEAFDYITNYSKEKSLEEYLKVIEGTKKAVDIPVIASINCTTASSWTKFGKKIQEAGADALELNISNLPTDIDRKSADYEKVYFDIVGSISKEISIPLSLKLNFYSAGLSNLIRTLDWTQKVKSFILFNRFYSPDLDIDKLKITSSNYFSNEGDYTRTLRWTALMFGNVEAELIASTGIHSGESVIKQILAGANAVQVVSAIYKNGPEHIGIMLKEIEDWMQKKNFKTIDDFKGKLSYDSVENPTAFERIQFMKYYGGIE
ncbi:MAG: dihydroorotate dehydrogenase-like protein [Bacteroidales bacterium]|nr:dihydroorotate dehydrogenase-like protein [Bacteroidales bacterium]MBN2755575.1 dihydroorotate dehydrogenase-like protein [Bacteroidales bacterium]